jgi:hypothetical protein
MPQSALMLQVSRLRGFDQFSRQSTLSLDLETTGVTNKVAIVEAKLYFLVHVIRAGFFANRSSFPRFALRLTRRH